VDEGEGKEGLPVHLSEGEGKEESSDEKVGAGRSTRGECLNKYDSPPSLQRSFCQRDWKGYPRSTKTGKLVLSKEEKKKKKKNQIRVGAKVGSFG
jgi:hypothetical protein